MNKEKEESNDNPQEHTIPANDKEKAEGIKRSAGEGERNANAGTGFHTKKVNEDGSIGEGVIDDREKNNKR